jgi:spore maturation protein CgeB
MAEAKRILLISDFRNHLPQSINVERRRWFKGLIRTGNDVQRFSFRNIMKEFSPFKSRTLCGKIAQKRAFNALISQIKSYHPDIVFILTMKDLSSDNITEMRRLAPKAIFVGRDTDWFPERNKERLAIARQMDIVTPAYAGEWLRVYKNIGVPLCAFIPFPCDPDIQHPYPAEERFKTDIIFTGSVLHIAHQDKFAPDRYSIVKKLSQMPNARIYGAFGVPKIAGIDVFRAISNAKIALSINAYNNMRMYHSDRLVNCLSCGTFTLAKRVPDTDLLFKDKVHLRYFDSADEFFEMADWYLKHDDEREKIAQAGMEHAHKEFNCAKIAGYMLDCIDNGSYKAPWTV